jgi:hypothetical protein
MMACALLAAGSISQPLLQGFETLLLPVVAVSIQIKCINLELCVKNLHKDLIIRVDLQE